MTVASVELRSTVGAVCVSRERVGTMAVAAGQNEGEQDAAA